MDQDSKKSPFGVLVEQALKHYDDAQWLGEKSPLASPYFLGTRLPAQAVSARARGRVLQDLLRTCTIQISGRNQERYQTILQEYYFKERPVEVVCDLIGLGRNSFHLSRNDAITALADLLILQTNPTLRLETPPQAGHLLERAAPTAQALAALQAGQAVTITGSGGVGKTALGSTLARQTGRPLFWFTIHPGLNDHWEALLFALGYFLYTQNSPTLWLEVVAANNKLKPDRLLGIVRYALAQVQPQPPLLCFDEVDLLTPAKEANHALFVKLLESLRGLAPLLLIGQRPVMETDHFFTLGGLSTAAIQHFFITAGLTLGNEQAQAIHHITQGNPRLLHLLLALQQSGEPFAQAMAALGDQPALEFLLNRILQRLGEQERSILLELTVFRRSAPQQIWEQRHGGELVRRLLDRHLLQQDQTGGLFLLPAYRVLLYQQLPVEKRQTLHTAAAAIRASYGDTVAAIYHWIGAGQPEQAIWFWQQHRQSAINQGQATTALALLQSLAALPLSTLARESLVLATAELERLTGNATKALEDLHSILWQTPILALDAHHLAGMIANDQSDFTGGERAFRHALGLAEQMVEARLSHLHRGLAWRYLRERDMTRAVEETERAHYELRQLQGELQRELGHYSAAAEHFAAALQIAEQLDYLEGIAKTSTSLSSLYIIQGQVAGFKGALTKAAAAYQRMGKVVQLASLQINYAVAYNLAGEYEEAIQAAQQAQSQLTRFGAVSTYQRLLIAQAMSESYLGLDNLPEATHYVRQIIEAEEVVLLPDAYLTFGEILRKEGKFSEAVRFLRMSLDLATQNEDRYIAGYGWRALGSAYAGFDPTQAQAAFQQAIMLFQAMNLPNEVEKTVRTAEAGRIALETVP
jgi:tetratricopeptide (TPR) repeat protein